MNEQRKTAVRGVVMSRPAMPITAVDSVYDPRTEVERAFDLLYRFVDDRMTERAEGLAAISMIARELERLRDASEAVS